MKQYKNPQGEIQTPPAFTTIDGAPFQATDEVLKSQGWTIDITEDPQPQPTEADLLRQQITDKQAQIAEAKAALTASDYQVIKCAECDLTGDPSPYDIENLHRKREAYRNAINNLESVITALQAQIADLEPPMEEETDTEAEA